MTQNEIIRFYSLADVLGKIETVVSASVRTDDKGAPTEVHVEVYDGVTNVTVDVRPIFDPDRWFGKEIVWGLTVPNVNRTEEVYTRLSSLIEAIRNLS